jgi:Ca2+-binding RTX toxin-like protein
MVSALLISDGSNFLPEQTCVITVTSVNDNPVIGPIDDSLSANTVAENASIGTAVGIKALATDADSGATISYSLTDNAGGKFAIDPTTGVVTLAGSLDYESATTHNVTVLATSSDGSTNSQVFGIAVINVDDNPVVGPVDVNGAANTVSENASIGTLVGITAHASDADADAAITSYTLINSAGGRFAIDAITGVVTVAGVLDYESAATHDITVLATSSDGSTNSGVLSIAVTNANEAPNITTSTLSVEENIKPIGMVAATDPDAGDGRIYSLIGGADVSRFSIHATTGALSFVNAPDFENPVDIGGNNQYDVTVRVTDTGGLFDDQAVVVTVTNDSTEAPITATNTGVTVPKSSTGTIITNALLNTTDQDSGSGQIVYTLTAVPAHGTLYKIGVALSIGSTFTQTNINANNITYSNNGDLATTDGFSFTISDGTNVLSAQTFAVTVINPIITGTDNAETLTGTGAAEQFDAKAGNDYIYGLGGNDTILGGDGNDTLNGGVGADFMQGGIGDDRYEVDNASDSVVESLNQGTDIIYSTVAWTLGANIERLYLTGNAAINATGNNLDNILYGNGNSAANVLTGGLGNDIYYAGAGDSVVEAVAGGTDIVFSFGNYTLATNVENLYLNVNTAATLTGNALANSLRGSIGADVLIGLAGNDTLDGGLGGDTMYGDDGNDTYYIDNVGDSVIEVSSSGGVDRVYSSLGGLLGVNIEGMFLTGSATINATGNELGNTLDGTGNSAANVLTGGTGDDIYYLGAGDTAVENNAEGIDSVYCLVAHTLAANIENLYLNASPAATLTGNELANSLRGNAGADTLYSLAGNDTLDGGLGADTMYGGAGDDRYEVNTAGDNVVELFGEGIDTVYSTVTLTLGANVERLYLTGSAVINATGNNLDNTLYGNGNSAANVLTGGLGNDLYYAGAGDSVVEAVAGGTDIVFSFGNFTLAANVENLYLNVATSATLTGNELANSLRGNTGSDALIGLNGNDTLTGGLGNDTLTGGAGGDIFRFDTLPNATSNLDTIIDYSVVDDTVQLENAIFASLTTTGALATGSFITGNSAVDADDYLIYSSSSGALYYDADANGAGAAVQFATLSSGLALTSTDFFVT